jgi:hypothetical protein
LGTSYTPVENSYNCTVLDKFGNPVIGCTPTYTSLETFLPDVTDFSIGDKVRIRHTYIYNMTPYFCNYHYFEAE